MHGGGFTFYSGSISAALGLQTYGFPYTTRGIELSADTEGNLVSGNGWMMTRALMIGADNKLLKRMVGGAGLEPATSCL